MKTSIRLLSPLALLALAGPVLATPAPAIPAAAERTATAAPAAAAPLTRDWQRIDTDRDGYISAAEMQTYLAAEQTRQRNTTVATK